MRLSSISCTIQGRSGRRRVKSLCPCHSLMTKRNDLLSWRDAHQGSLDSTRSLSSSFYGIVPVSNVCNRGFRCWNFSSFHKCGNFPRHQPQQSFFFDSRIRSSVAQFQLEGFRWGLGFSPSIGAQLAEEKRCWHLERRGDNQNNVEGGRLHTQIGGY